MSRGAWRMLEEAVSVELEAKGMVANRPGHQDAALLLAFVVRGTKCYPSVSDTRKDLAAAMR